MRRGSRPTGVYAPKRMLAGESEMRRAVNVRTRRGPWKVLCGLAPVLVLTMAAGCTNSVPPRVLGASHGSTTTAPLVTTSTAPATTTTQFTCPKPAGTAQTVPVDETCSAAGAPHFYSPDAAMEYLAAAWNANNVQEIDYVTSPAGRDQLNSMASEMPNLRFTDCEANPSAGDYTCFFSHDIVPSTSPTTYPNPNNYPPGEAVFTVGPASAPGWYLTIVDHCG